MFIITATRGERHWISGIFLSKQDAEAYMNLIPDELKQYQKIVELNGFEYPFYIFEEKDKFDYVNEEEMVNRLQNIEQNEDTKVVYFNIYTIRQDYQPQKPGTDYMGILPHDHINNSFLAWYRKEGKHFLVRRGIV